MDQPPRIHGSAILLGTAADFFLTMVIDSIFVLARLVFHHVNQEKHQDESHDDKK